MNSRHNKDKGCFGTSIALLFSGALLGTGFWFALTSTLDDMTRRDCEYGVQAACEQLKK
tara:strand:- start:719 stop:895 length:177 start_codon:yes stop_codon:yes gene_type:complete